MINTVVKCNESVVESILNNEEQISHLSNISLEPQILFKEKASLIEDPNHVNSIHRQLYSLRGLLKPRGVYNQLDIPLCSEFTEEIIEFRQHRTFSTFAASSCCNAKIFPAPISPIPNISGHLLKKNTNGYFNRQRQAYRALQQRRIKRNAITYAFTRRDRHDRANHLFNRYNQKRRSKTRLNIASLLLLKEMRLCSVELEKLSEEFIADSTIISEIKASELQFTPSCCSSQQQQSLQENAPLDHLEVNCENDALDVRRSRRSVRPPFYKYRDTPVRLKNHSHHTCRKSIVMSPVSYDVKEFVLIKPNNNNNNLMKEKIKRRRKKRYNFTKPLKRRQKTAANKTIIRKTSMTNLPLSGPKSVRVIISPTCKARADIFLAKDVGSTFCDTTNDDDDDDGVDSDGHRFDNCSSLNYYSEGQSTWQDVDSSFLTSSDESTTKFPHKTTATTTTTSSSGRIISASLISSHNNTNNNLRHIHKSLSIHNSLDNKCKDVTSSSCLTINSNRNNSQCRPLKYRYKLIRSSSFQSQRAKSESPSSNSMKSTNNNTSSTGRVPLNELKVLDRRDSHSTENHSSPGSFQTLRHSDLPCSSLSEDSPRCLDHIDSLSDSTIETPRQSRRQRRPSLSLKSNSNTRNHEVC